LRTALPLTLVLFAVSLASWVCPVFKAPSIDPSDLSSLHPPALLESLEVVITPVPISTDAMRDYAEWNYMISESFSITSNDDSGNIVFCIDLGVVPEGRRELLSVKIDGVETAPCSTLARPCSPTDLESEENSSCIFRQNSYHPVYSLESISDYRNRFSREEDFRSAIPETARFYVALFDFQTNGKPVDVEIIYISRGWTYLTGGNPLHFSLLQPCLLMNPAAGASLLIDLSGIPQREDWLIEFMGNEFNGEDKLKFFFENFDYPDMASYPVLSITSPDLRSL